jgi:hypothetical protein
MRRSPALGVIELRTTLTPENATASQINDGRASARAGRMRPAFDSTTTATRASNAAWPRAAARIAGGYRPGNFPPIAYAPHGAPSARATWNAMTPAVTTANRSAATSVTSGTLWRSHS